MLFINYSLIYQKHFPVVSGQAAPSPERGIRGQCRGARLIASGLQGMHRATETSEQKYQRCFPRHPRADKCGWILSHVQRKVM